MPDNPLKRQPEFRLNHQGRRGIQARNLWRTKQPAADSLPADDTSGMFPRSVKLTGRSTPRWVPEDRSENHEASVLTARSELCVLPGPLAYTSTVKVEARCSFEILGHFYQTIRLHILEETTFLNQCCEDLKSNIIVSTKTVKHLVFVRESLEGAMFGGGGVKARGMDRNLPLHSLGALNFLQGKPS
jgi:hypothetical protein